MSDYTEVLRAEVKVDCYAGDDCDTHEKYFNCYAEGDKQDDDSREPLVIDLRHFPAGTRISVQEPVCPECQMSASCCIEFKQCSFDWREWAEGRYT